eukprot:2772290-Amphidinium_carterae.1
MSIVCNLVRQGEVELDDIGVVTPYAAQVSLVRAKARKEFGDGEAPRLEVASVDAFQGREKTVIVFSAVRCNASGRL